MWALILNISFIGEVPTSYAPPPPLIVFSEKHKYIFNLENISRPSIILYLWLPCKWSTSELQVILFIAYILTKNIYTLIV